jgi:CheY-like chemotaxis protein
MKCSLEFTPKLGLDSWTLNDISAAMEGASLMTLFMSDGKAPSEEVLHFIVDTLVENSMQIIIVGNSADLQYACDHIPRDLIYMTFSRPVDNAVFADAVTEFFIKAGSSEFKKSILIVDDDPQYLTLIREWLKGTYKVSMANSGLQAIKFLGKHKVDLILLDHEMPITGGPQVLEMLRNDPETKSIPVIFLTGKSDKESVMKVVALRPEGYFLKNIQKEELLEKLRESFIFHK